MALGEERERGEAKGMRLPPRLTKAQRQRAEEREGRGQKVSSAYQGARNLIKAAFPDWRTSLSKLSGVRSTAVPAAEAANAHTSAMRAILERTCAGARAYKNNGERQCGCAA